MSTKIPVKIIQALIAMHKDPKLLASELTVRVNSCEFHRHSHFQFSSPFVEDKSFGNSGLILTEKASLKGVVCVSGEYTFRLTPVDGVKCISPETPDATTVEFLLQSSVSMILHTILNHLGTAFREWPDDETTKSVLGSEYARIMRENLLHKNGSLPFGVRVSGKGDQVLKEINDLFSPFLPFGFGFGQNSAHAKGNMIDLTAFSSNNFCVMIMRQAYAEHAKMLLGTQVIPVILPKLKDRVSRVFDAQDAYLVQFAQQTAKESEQTAVSDPASESGFGRVGPESPEVKYEQKPQAGSNGAVA